MKYVTNENVLQVHGVENITIQEDEYFHSKGFK